MPLEREAALGVLRRHLARVQTMVRDSFEQSQVQGLDAAHALSTLTDTLVVALHEHAMAVTEGQVGRLCLAATGGYGRGGLAVPILQGWRSGWRRAWWSLLQ